MARWLGWIALVSCLAWQACNGENFSSDDGAAGSSNDDSTSGGEAGDGGGGGRSGTEGGGRSGNSAGGTTDPGGGGEGDSGGNSATGGAGDGGSPGGGAEAGAPSGGVGGAAGAGGTTALGGSAGANGGGGADQGGSAGNAGTSGTGGTGTGGTGGSTVTMGCTPDTVVDDMEDGNDLVCMNAGRSGDWWIVKGPVTTSSVMPADPNFQAFPLGTNARTGSNYGMRMAGTGFGTSTDDYALLGFNPVNDQPYDASRYQGISFWGKSTMGSVRIRLSFAFPGTTPPEDGGTCSSLCFDYHHKDVTFATSWQPFVVSFAELAQEGWGPAAKDLTHLLYVLFDFHPPNPASFELLVDDVTFY